MKLSALDFVATLAVLESMLQTAPASVDKEAINKTCDYVAQLAIASVDQDIKAFVEKEAA